VIPPEAWAGGIVAAVAIGAFAGLAPAIRAASVSPTETLRTGLMATSMQPPSIHVDLRCDPGVAEAADRMLDRLDSVIGDDALTGLRAVLRTLVSAVP
jgi:hypothetical protein